jgi:hypothetical protein
VRATVAILIVTVVALLLELEELAVTATGVLAAVEASVVVRAIAVVAVFVRGRAPIAAPIGLEAASLAAAVT